MEVRSKFIRMTKVLSLAFTIFIQIYWYKLRRKPESEWEKLWGNIGERFRKTLFELEGLLIKIGQILSIRSDLLPSTLFAKLETLRTMSHLLIGMIFRTYLKPNGEAVYIIS